MTALIDDHVRVTRKISRGCLYSAFCLSCDSLVLPLKDGGNNVRFLVKWRLQTGRWNGFQVVRVKRVKIYQTLDRG